MLCNAVQRRCIRGNHATGIWPVSATQILEIDPNSSRSGYGLLWIIENAVVRLSDVEGSRERVRSTSLSTRW